MSCKNDRLGLAERICRIVICAASIARGIGRVGGGTKRRPQHVFRASYNTRLYSLYPPTVRLAIRTGFCSFALGLMAKPMLVTLPFVLLLLDYWPLKRPVKPNLLYEKAPLFILLLLSSLLTYIVQRAGGQ